MGRTIKDIELPERSCIEVKDIMLEWFKRTNFEIKNKSDNYIKACRGSAAKVMAVGGLRFFFEIEIKQRGNSCFLHGEFYGRAIGPPDMSFIPRKFAFYGLPRKQGYDLMMDFLAHVTGEKRFEDIKVSLKQKVICPECRRKIPRNANICGYCGHRLKKNTSPNYCTECGNKFLKDARFCAHCGLELKEERKSNG